MELISSDSCLDRAYAGTFGKLGVHVLPEEQGRSIRIVIRVLDISMNTRLNLSIGLTCSNLGR